MPYRWAMAMQQYSCMAPIPLCGQRAVQGRESLTLPRTRLVPVVGSSRPTCPKHQKPIPSAPGDLPVLARGTHQITTSWSEVSGQRWVQCGYIHGRLQYMEAGMSISVTHLLPCSASACPWHVPARLHVPTHHVLGHILSTSQGTVFHHASLYA